MRQNERSISFNVDAYTARLIEMETVSKLEGAKGIVNQPYWSIIEI